MKYTAAILLLFCATVAYGYLPACTKQDGGFSKWLRWSPCSVSCGQGIVKRHRYCDNPVPKYGGAPCDGDSMETKKCVMEDCPPTGVYEEVKGECSKHCGGGTRKVTYECHPPTVYGTAKCYTNCPFKTDTTEECNTQKCENPIRNVCTGCKATAEGYSKTHGATFVGFACRIDASACTSLSYGIRDMYPANDWFFLHCSPDGPWCKPCATRTLVYNAKCGQCEATRDGDCTGEQTWQKKRNVLSDDELW